MRSKKQSSRSKSSRSRKAARYRDNLGVIAVMRCQLDEAEQRLWGLISGESQGPTTEGEDPCPDLSDPSAIPDVYFCQLAARAEYLLGLIDCEEYKKRVADCAITP